MTEILKTVGSVQLSSAFLLKSHFLKRPLTMLARVHKKTRVLESFIDLFKSDLTTIYKPLNSNTLYF